MAPEKIAIGKIREIVTLNNVTIKKICYHDIDITTSLIDKAKNNNEVLVDERINFNKMYGDPLPDVIKQIHFTYVDNEEDKVITIDEFEGIIQKDVHITSYKLDYDFKRKIFLYCNPDHMRTFTEYIKSFQHLINFEIIHDNSNRIRQDDIVISIYEKHPNIKCKNNCFINTEQITRLDVRNHISNIAKDNLILDYSQEHLRLMNSLMHLPYAYNKDEVDKLKKYLNDQPKLYDVAFVGFMSSKRQLVLDKLREKGVKVIIANTWADERDKLIAQSKILINIHYINSYNIYESIRCDRWLFAEHLIISEDSLLTNELDVKDLIIFEKYDNLVNKTIKVLNNYRDYSVNKEKLNSIIKNREEVILKTKRKMEEYHFSIVSKIDKLYDIKCQTISDIYQHLPTLYHYATLCDHITECGVRSVTSSYAFAKALKSKKNNKLIQIDLDTNDNVVDFGKLCKEEGINVIFYQISDLESPIEDTDLLFIDTWHVYGQLKRELARWHSYSKKYIIMHDTTVDGILGESVRENMDIATQSKVTGIPIEEIKLGLWSAIEEFLVEHKEFVLENKYENNNGLTILKRI